MGNEPPKPEKPVKEQIKEQKRSVERSARGLEREMRKLEREEKKIITEMRKMGQKGQDVGSTYLKLILESCSPTRQGCCSNKDSNLEDE